MISTLIPHDPGAARTLVTSVAMLALVTFGVYVGQWWEGGDSRVSLTYQSDLIADASDLEASPVVAIRYGDAPDSTRTDCIEVPTWPDSLGTTGMPTTVHDSTSGVETQPSSSIDSRTNPSARQSWSMAGLPYVITPMTNGRPSLSVGSDVATLQAFDPRSGRPLEFDYDIRKDWALWPELEARGTPGGLQASAQAALRYKGLTLTAGYEATADGRGWTAGVRWRPFAFRW